MRVLIADKLERTVREHLEDLGLVVHQDPSLAGDALAALIASFGPEVLIVRSTRVTQAHIDASPTLAVVVRAGAGTDTIDVAAAARNGVFVASCPGRNAIAVAELTFGLLLAIDRHIADGVQSLRAGAWAKGRFSKAWGLYGRSLGLLGFGGIGAEVARRARAFGMDVHVWSRSLSARDAAAAGITRHATPLEVAARVDVLSLHLALTPDTRHIVGARMLDAMRPGAVLINTARADLVDRVALQEALDQRGLRFGTDVFHDEPPGAEGVFSDPIGAHPSVVGSHHIGASTEQAQAAIAAEVVRIVSAWHGTGRVPGCVDLAERSAATHCLVVRHRDKVGVLASVLEVLREEGLNVQEMENNPFAGGAAASARIHVVGALRPEGKERLIASPDVWSVTVVPLTG